ncbi:MAG: sugar ABC transporter substrate-binding protein, partial [Gemmatimonadaceae bacterium]
MGLPSPLGLRSPAPCVAPAARPEGSRGDTRAALRVALLLVATMFGGCGGDDSGWGRALGGGGGRKRIGVVLPSRGLPYYQELEAGMREAARRERYELVVTDAGMNGAAQGTQAEGVLQQRVDAIVIAPVDSLSSVQAITRANAARIPVFTVGLRPAGGRIVSHVQADHVGAGRVVAEYLAAFLGGRGEVVLVSRSGVPALAEREQGFRAAMRAHRGI